MNTIEEGVEQPEDTPYISVPEKNFQVKALEDGKYQVALDPGFVDQLPAHRKKWLCGFFDPATERYAVIAAWDGAIPYAKRSIINVLNGYKPQQAQPIRWR